MHRAGEKMRQDRYSELDKLRKSVSDSHYSQDIKQDMLHYADVQEVEYRNEDKLQDIVNEQREQWEINGGDPTLIEDPTVTITIGLTNGKVTNIAISPMTADTVNIDAEYQ